MAILGNGSNVLLFDANGSPLACQRSANVQFNDELIDVTCKQSNGNVEYLAGKRNFNVTCEALTDWGQNLLLWSEEFSNAEWIDSNVIVSSDFAIAPNGTMTADELEATLASNGIYQSISTENSITLSVYAKAGSSNFIYLDIFDVTPPVDYVAIFDLSNGTYVGNGGSGTVDDYTIQNAGNGWYRISITKDIGSGVQNHNYVIGVAQAGNLNTAIPNTTVLIWGAQLNTGTTAESYYKTTSSTNLNIDTITTAFGNRSKLEINIANPAFSDVYFNGECYVESIEQNAGTEDVASYTVTLSGTGDFQSLVS